MNRDEIYQRLHEAIYLSTGVTTLQVVPAKPNVDYWLTGIKDCAKLIQNTLARYPVGEGGAAWGVCLTNCCLCMMQNGVVRRGLGPVDERVMVRGLATLRDVTVVINGERAYQDTRGISPSPYGHAVTLDNILRRAFDAWTNYGIDHALDEIRKLAGICVHCLEDCYEPTQ